MGSALGIDGLASGLNTTDIINSLMKLEAAPQTLLKSKQSTLQSVVAALQGVNVRVQSVQSAAAKAADPAEWNAYTATSNSAAVAVSAAADANPGALTFRVASVAARQVSLSAAVSDGSQLTADNPPTLTIKKADGTYASVTAASNSLSDITSAINGSELGIKATAVRVTGGATPTYRLQFTSDATGLDGGFELYAGDEAAVVGGTATRLDAAMATPPANASIVLWQGTASEQTISQSSNTFEDVMDGVTLTLSDKVEAGEDVTVTVAADSTKVKSLASDMINALSVVLKEIDSRTATTTSTGDDGRVVVTGGLLSGDSAIRSIHDQLTRAVMYPVDGKSPSSVGISITRDGAIEFDQATFSAAVQEDPDGTAAMVQAIAARLDEAATSISDSREGTLTSKITSNESMVTDYGRQIENWDRRLELRRSSLQATYSALEVTLSNLQSQSSWLSGQLASLPTYSD